MAVDADVVPVSLERPPVVVACGVGVHGQTALRQSWVLPSLHALHVYNWTGQVTIDEVTYPITPGVVTLIPPGSQMTFDFPGVSEHLFAHLLLPVVGPPTPVPMFYDLAERADDVRRRLAVLTPRVSRARRAAEIWALLWDLSELAPTSSQWHTAPDIHPALRTVIDYVQDHLADPLTVADLAKVGAVSQSQLRRLSHEHLNQSMSSYVRSQRQTRAHHLLRDSTLPVQSVAAAVGISDLQAFNKVCHQWFGQSPREFRARHQAGAGQAS